VLLSNAKIGGESLCDLVVSALQSKGLISIGSSKTMMTPNGVFDKRTTEFGDQFLAFVSEPKSAD
jgi:hypothetical protein